MGARVAFDGVELALGGLDEIEGHLAGEAQSGNETPDPRLDPGVLDHLVVHLERGGFAAAVHRYLAVAHRGVRAVFLALDEPLHDPGLLGADR